METTDEGLWEARMGPYQELAWRLQIELVTGLSQEQHSAFLTSLIGFLEVHQLGVAGDPARGRFVIVSLLNRKAVSQQQQLLVTDWLAGRSEVHRVADTEAENYFSDAWMEYLLVAGEDTCSPLFNCYFGG